MKLTFALNASATPSSRTFTASPTFKVVSRVSGTNVRTLIFAGGSSDTTGLPAATTSVVAAGASLTRLASGLRFTEGPAGGVYFTETAVLVSSASGTKLEQIAVPERPTNLEFGGSDRQTLFITTDAGSLYSIRMRVQGMAGGASLP